MPLTLNVGVCKKIGQPDYGSLGASCNIQVELDAGLLADDLDGFHQRVRQAYVACAQAVNDELARHQNAGGQARQNGHSNGAPGNSTAANGHNGNGSARNGTGRATTPRKATASQVRAIHAIADRQQLDLPALLQDRFGCQQLDALSVSEASQLIDELKASTNGVGGGR